jgi:hypothetical protein
VSVDGSAGGGQGGVRAPRLLRLSHRWRVAGAAVDVARPQWLLRWRALPALPPAAAAAAVAALPPPLQQLGRCAALVGASAAAAGLVGAVGARAPSIDARLDEYGLLRSPAAAVAAAPATGSGTPLSSLRPLAQALTRSQCMSLLAVHTDAVERAVTRPHTAHAAALSLRRSLAVRACVGGACARGQHTVAVASAATVRAHGSGPVIHLHAQGMCAVFTLQSLFVCLLVCLFALGFFSS